MLNKTLIKKFTLMLFVVLAFGCAGADAQPEAVIRTGEAAEKIQTDTDAKKPLVVYYSQNGQLPYASNNPGNHLNAEVDRNAVGEGQRHFHHYRVSSSFGATINKNRLRKTFRTTALSLSLHPSIL